MTQKIKQQWFLVSLVFIFLAVTLDTSNSLANIGIALKNYHGPGILIFLIFVISGLLIEGDQIRAGIRDVKSTLLALSVIVIFAPIVAWCLCLLPLETGVVVGLFIVAVMPTTLSSGIVMTGVAGGNMAHALFVTILSNFISIFSIPAILSILLSTQSMEKELVIDQGVITAKLFLLVLFPLLIGIWAKAKVFKENYLERFKLQVINQWMIIGVVFISLSGAKQTLLGESVSFFYIVFLVSVFHLMLLGFSFLLVKIFDIKKGCRESIIFMGSQKTLALAVVIQVSYFSEFGMALLVCVIHHIAHLMMDSYLSVKMNK